MSFRKEVQKELEEFKAWAEEANLQAHLAKAEIKAEVRSIWMEAEQTAAKLEATIEKLGDVADQGASEVLEQLKEKYQKVKAALND